MAVIGQTRAQFQQQQALMRQATIAQIQQVKQFKKQLALQKQQYFYENFIEQAISVAGGDPIVAAQMNPELFDRFFSFTQGNLKAKAATNMLARGNISGPGVGALMQYYVAGGKAIRPTVEVTSAKAYAKRTGSTEKLEKLANEAPTEKNALSRAAAKQALSEWNPETKKFEGKPYTFKEFTTERARVRGGETVVPLVDQIKDFKDQVNSFTTSLKGVTMNLQPKPSWQLGSGTPSPLATEPAFQTETPMSPMQQPGLSQNPYTKALQDFQTAVAQSQSAPAATADAKERREENQEERRKRREQRQAERQIRRLEREYENLSEDWWMDDALEDLWSDTPGGGPAIYDTPVMASGGQNPQMQMQAYNQMTGDVHRPAMIGDQEMVMNRNATKVFGPILQAMNEAVPNPAAAVAPQSMPMNGGNQAPVAAAGMLPAFLSIASKVMNNNKEEKESAVNQMMQRKFGQVGQVPIMADGGMPSAPAPMMPPAGSGFNIPGVTPSAGSGMINPNTPIEQIAAMLTADPSIVNQLTDQQLLDVQSFLSQETDKLEKEASASWLKDSGTESVPGVSSGQDIAYAAGQMIGNQPGMEQAGSAMASQGYAPSGAPDTSQMPMGVGPEGMVPGMQEAGQAIAGRGLDTSTQHQTFLPQRATGEATEAEIQYGRRAAPPIPETPPEVIEARGEKAQMAMDKVEAGEEPTPQEANAMHSAASKSARWLIRNKNAKETPIDDNLMEFFLNAYYPEGMSLIDLTTSPAKAEQLKQGRKQLELAEKAETRMEKARLTAIEQFNETMAFNRDKLAASEEAQMLADKMKLNADMYKVQNARRWSEYETIRDDFTYRLRDMAKNMKTDMSDPEVQKKFNLWVASNPEQMRKMNEALRIMAESTGLEILQSWELVPDEERAGFWFNINSMLGRTDRLGPLSESGEPVTAQFGSTATSNMGAAAAPEYVDQPMDLQSEVNDLLMGLDY